MIPLLGPGHEGDATVRKSTLISVSISVSIAVLAAGVAISAQDKYTVKPNFCTFLENMILDQLASGRADI